METGGKIARGPKWRCVTWWRCDGNERKYRRLQEVTKSRDNVAMGTGRRTAVVTKQRRVTGCGCYGDSRKHPPAFKMAPNHVVKVAEVTDASTALIPIRPRATGWRCYGEGGKNRPDSKTAALLRGRAEVPRFQDGGAPRDSSSLKGNRKRRCN